MVLARWFPFSVGGYGVASASFLGCYGRFVFVFSLFFMKIWSLSEVRAKRDVFVRLVHGACCLGQAFFYL
jgi:hypothetical protein